MKKIYEYLLPIFIIGFILVLCGWGSTGHKIISTDATLLFKGKAATLSYLSGQIINHASDADYRKSSDPSESPKHFIDIDSYPEFVSTGKINMYYDSVVSIHGQNFVTDAGTLPWAILNTFDSLKAAFLRNDWDKAGLTAADLGHYVGDSHMPLHLTENYNGYQTNQSGVHSRYETDLINQYSSQIKYDLDSLSFIPDVRTFVFSYIYQNYKYKDSVLNADKEAALFAGSNKSQEYYQKFWELAGSFTDTLFKYASCRLADLIYTAWREAGSPQQGISGTKEAVNNPGNFILKQNYPNPFNPETSIDYELAYSGYVSLTIFDPLGRVIAVPVNGPKSAGRYTIKFNAGNMPSGVYIYRLRVNMNNSFPDRTQVKKMILLK